MSLRGAAFALLLCLSVSAETTLPEPSQTTASEPQAETPAPPACPAGGPIGQVDLKVKSADSKDEPLPLRTINRVGEGDTILYSPILRGREKRPGEVALVMVPRKRSGNETLIVTDPFPADKPATWKVSEAMSIVVYVYGPGGLSRKKVQGFLSQDDLLISQLADYAEKTAQTEALIQALSDADASAASVSAALSGFAAQYGAVGPIDRTQPTSVQAATLFNQFNPQLAAYDPLVPSANARVAQTAGLMTAAAGLFFATPVGLAAGGTAMVLDLRSIAFPGTQFRSSFAQPIPSGLHLCGQRTPAPPHTRIAYLWANRIPNAPLPNLEIGKASYIPPGLKTAVPVTTPDATWRYLDRARLWTLADDSHHRYPIKMTKLSNQKSLELDLTKQQVPPGDYQLSGAWDWQPFIAKGEVHVRGLSDFSGAEAEAASQDRLLAKGGKTVLTLDDGDFEFTDKVELKKTGDEFAAATAVPFALPKGPRQGPQEHLDVQIDTKDLDPGQYQLLISQADGKPHALAINILPNPPSVTNLPILLNEGEAQQHYVLKGERLNLITGLSSQGADLSLAPSGSDPTQRNLTVRLTTSMAPGTIIPIAAHIENRKEPLVFADGLKITGPLPVIASSKLSLPTDLGISLQPGDLPAGTTLAAVLDVKNAARDMLLEIGCEGESSGSELKVGAQTEHWSLQQLSLDQLFVSYDTTALPTGCNVQAKLVNGAVGQSSPYTLARIVRIPQIEQFATAADPAEGKRAYLLQGRNLEMIERVGWDQLAPVDVQDLPAPVPGQGQKQSLKVALPDPPPTPTAALYVWLRGDKLGRSTTVTTTPPPVSPKPAAVSGPK